MSGELHQQQDAGTRAAVLSLLYGVMEVDLNAIIHASLSAS